MTAFDLSHHYGRQFVLSVSYLVRFFVLVTAVRCLTLIGQKVLINFPVIMHIKKKKNEIKIPVKRDCYTQSS